MSDCVGIFIILISSFCGGFALGVKWGEPMNDPIRRQDAIDALGADNNVESKGGDKHESI